MAHPKFGKGLVVAVDGGRIDVLFEEGVKKLVHGVSWSASSGGAWCTAPARKGDRVRAEWFAAAAC
ncbi:MAG: hypothetical protein R3A52_19660 [Polyangiales bacterium]